MVKIEVELPEGVVRFLYAMQVLWQLPPDWTKHYMSNAIIKVVENDADSFLDKEKIKELYGIGKTEYHELPSSSNKEAITT